MKCTRCDEPIKPASTFAGPKIVNFDGTTHACRALKDSGNIWKEIEIESVPDSVIQGYLDRREIEVPTKVVPNTRYF